MAHNKKCRSHDNAGAHLSLGTRAGTCPCTRVRTSARFAHPSAQRAHRAKIIICTPERLASHSTVLGNNFHNVIARTQCAAPHESIMKHYLHLKGPGEKSLCLWCHTLHDSLTGKAKVSAFLLQFCIFLCDFTCMQPWFWVELWKLNKSASIHIEQAFKINGDCQTAQARCHWAVERACCRAGNSMVNFWSWSSRISHFQNIKILIIY